MDTARLLQLRLVNQRLLSSPLTRPQDVVAALGAVQAQDYPAAKWAVGQRLQQGTDAEVEKAFDGGRILRNTAGVVMLVALAWGRDGLDPTPDNDEVYADYELRVDLMR